MPKFKLLASYGYAQTEEMDDCFEAETQEEADEVAWDLACERLSAWAEIVEEEEE